MTRWSHEQGPYVDPVRGQIKIFASVSFHFTNFSVSFSAENETKRRRLVRACIRACVLACMRACAHDPGCVSRSRSRGSLSRVYPAASLPLALVRAAHLSLSVPWSRFSRRRKPSHLVPPRRLLSCLIIFTSFRTRLLSTRGSPLPPRLASHQDSALGPGRFRGCARYRPDRKPCLLLKGVGNCCDSSSGS